MKLSENFFYTLREDLKDEESISGNLLVKSLSLIHISEPTRP